MPEEGKNGLVHESADAVISPGVDVMKVSAQNVEGQLEGGSDVLVVEAEPGDQRLGALAFPSQPALLFVEQLIADSSSLMRVEELALLLLDLGKDGSAASDLPL